MNRRKIWFAGLVTTVVGVGVGIILAKIVDSPYTSQAYQDQRIERIYIVIGGVGGFIVGTTQEALRQLQEERDRLDSDNDSQSSHDEQHHSS